MIVLMKVCGVFGLSFFFVLEHLHLPFGLAVNKFCQGCICNFFYEKKYLYFAEISFAIQPCSIRLCSGFAGKDFCVADVQQLRTEYDFLNNCKT